MRFGGFTRPMGPVGTAALLVFAAAVCLALGPAAAVAQEQSDQTVLGQGVRISAIETACEGAVGSEAAALFGGIAQDTGITLQASNTVGTMVPGEFRQSQARQLLDMVNAARAAAGRAPLGWDVQLEAVAMQRAAEIAVLFDAAHTRPNGEECFTLYPDDRYMVGENIAYGYPDAAWVNDGWTNSPGHYQNMINSGFGCMGAGCFVSNGTVYWVEAFSSGGGTGMVVAPIDEPRTAIVDVRFVATSGGAESVTVEEGLTSSPISIATWWGVPVPNDIFSWTTADDSIARVDVSGAVTGYAPGSTTVDVTDPQTGALLVSVPVRVTVSSYDGFYDVPEGIWYDPWVDAVVDQGLMKGIGAKRFDPNANMTRGQALVVLYRMMTGAPVDEEAGLDRTPFADVNDGDYFTNAVNWAYANGYATGYTNGEGRLVYAPNDSISRQDLAVLVWRVMGKPAPVDGGAAYASCADAGAEAAYATDALKWTASVDVLSGVSGVYLDAYAPTLRCQGAKIFVSAAALA